MSEFNIESLSNFNDVKTLKSDVEDLQNSIGHVLNVKDYNLVGDGIVDDSIAFNTLLSSIGSTPADILFPRGTYKLSSDMTIPVNIVAHFMAGAVLSPESEKAVTINGGLEAGLYQIFGGSSSTPILGAPNVLEIYPEWFGAKGDSSADDSVAFLKTFILASNTSGKKLPIKLAPKKYRLTQSLPLFNGMALIGSSIANKEFQNRAVIRNDTSDIFIFNADKSDIYITGVEFYGNTVNVNTSCFQAQDLSNGYILMYSTIEKCGFNFFNYALNGRILGVHFQQNYINNGQHCLRLAGSDSIIRDNLLDGKDFGTSNANTVFRVSLEGLSLTRFENNYITGRPITDLSNSRKQQCMYVSGGTSLIISKNWIDYSDGCGVYMVDGNNHNISDNFFRYCVRNPYDQYAGAIVVFDTKNCCIHRNSFEQNGGSSTAYAIRKSSAGCSKIYILDNIFDTNSAEILVNATIDGNQRIFLNGYMFATATYDPASLNNGDVATTTLTLNGAVLGDTPLVSFSQSLSGVELLAYVSTTDTVTVKFINRTGSTVDLASGTLKVKIAR